MDQDFKDLLAVFNNEQVKYLIIGGYAVIKYTEPRYTKDLDLCVEADLGGVKACFISMDDLIANKESVGRYQDLADAEKLRAAKQ